MGVIDPSSLGRFPWLWLPALPYRSPTGPLRSCSGAIASSWTLWPVASTVRERPCARREPGSRRCRVSQHDLSLRVCARQMANCSSAAENSELRVPQDSLFAAAVAVDENGLTFAARRGSQRGAGRSRRRFWGSSLLEEGTLRHGWMPCMCEEKRQTAGQRSRHRTMRRAKGAAEAPPPASDWPPALPRSAPRYRSLLLPG